MSAIVCSVGAALAVYFACRLWYKRKLTKTVIAIANAHLAQIRRYEEESKAFFADREANWMKKPDYELYRRDHRRFVAVDAE